MEYTPDYIDETVLAADKIGKKIRNDEDTYEEICRQLSQSIIRGNGRIRKTYDHPLSDRVLEPFCEASHVIVKARISKYIQKDITSYEYTFIFNRGDGINE
ncbi:hypothetical protein [Companilactobacillus sp. HBUAS56257]|uniref:hypothetical protein n=1 Tax=Companilactobacillus sp. HBUAS56257 TaxID=3109360 RepID=UPI002FF026D6